MLTRDDVFGQFSYIERVYLNSDWALKHKVFTMMASLDPDDCFVCDECRNLILNTNKVVLYDTVPYSFQGWYCRHCADAMLARFTFECAACGASFTTNKGTQSTTFCPECYSSAKISGVVGYNNQRALALREPATLTLREWEITLNDFNHSCAYCGGSYEVLEHFIPLGHGAGTTIKNCVPACQKCNSIKNNKMPVGERYDRVRIYLAHRGIFG